MLELLVEALDYVFRDLSTATYEPLLAGTSSNTGPHGMGECQMTNPGGENYPTWHQAYVPTGLGSSSMSSTLYPHIQVDNYDYFNLVSHV